jgi:hypothetical protein
MGNLQEAFVVPAKAILAQVGQFAVGVLLFLFILIVGWLISKFVIKIVVTRVLRFLKLDELSKRIEFDALLAKGGISVSLSELVGVICYWLALLVTFMVALNAVGLTIAADLLQRIVLFIPNIIAAIFILIAGMFVAVILKNIVKTAGSNAGISQGNLLSKITEVVIMVFAVSMALEQLQIGARIVELTISIILGALGLGFALAFGLGCKDIAAKSVTEFLNRLKK